MMKTIRILFTGVGRRVELIKAFRQAAYTEKIDLKIYGADISITAPALAFCDYTRISSHMESESYIDELISICCDDQIDLVIPTIDTDLIALSKNKKLFGNTKVLISDEKVINICRNKFLTSLFIRKCGLNVPKTYESIEEYDGTFPCLIKPVNGSSSINVFKAKNENELCVFADQVCDYVIQSVVEGTEYTVDVLCDFESNPIFITPRIRTQTRAGEVIKTEINLDQRIIKECKKIVENLHPIGPLAIQLIRNEEDEDVFIEINGRFGGGSPLSMNAGANSAQMILELLAGKTELDYMPVENHVLYSRYEQSVRVSKTENLKSVQGVIFDLDDTLYNEKQYVRSGFKAIAEYLNDNKAEQYLWSIFEKGLPVIDVYLNEKGLADKKLEVLKVYREHYPTISLNDGVIETIEALKEKGIKVGIITDGRSIGQRKKISALGLDELFDEIIITDELGGVQFRKPNDIAFRIMQCRWGIPFERIVYVGDNAEKDAFAPLQLGMKYIWFQNGDGLYNSKSDICLEILSIDKIDRVLRLIL